MTVKHECQDCGRPAMVCVDCGAPDARTRGPDDDPGDPWCDKCHAYLQAYAERLESDLMLRGEDWP